MVSDGGDRSGGDIQAVTRTADVLGLLVQSGGRITLRDAVERLGIQRTTMHRYFATMQAVGLLSRVDDGARAHLYGFGPLVHQMGAAIVNSSRVAMVAGGRLQRIADRVGVTAVLSLPSRGSAVVTDSAFPLDVPIAVRITAGWEIPPDGAQSILMLAHMDDDTVAAARASLPAGQWAAFTEALTRARTDGYIAKLVGDDLRVIAAPIFEQHAVCATIGVIGLAAELSGPSATAAVALLVAEARDVSAVLGRRPLAG